MKDSPTRRYREEYCVSCKYRKTCWGAVGLDNIQSNQEILACKAIGYFEMEDNKGA